MQPRKEEQEVEKGKKEETKTWRVKINKGDAASAIGVRKGQSTS